MFVVALLVAGFAYAEDLSDYPEAFVDGGNFNAYIVVGNKAPAFHVILQSKLISFFNEYTGKQISGRAKLASEISDLNENLIFIGNPCENEIESLMQSYPLSCEYLDGKSGIFFVEYDDYNHIIIAGTDDDIKKHIDDLLNYKKEEIGGTEHNVKEIENISKEDETQKIMEELSKKIANNALNEDIPPKEHAEVNQTTFEPKPVKNDTMQKGEQKEIPKGNAGLFSRIINWLKGMFS